LGNDVLIPVDRIKHITRTDRGNGQEINIISDDGDWSENFGKDIKKCDERYKMMKKIVKAL